jgi:hypothetical protein
LESALHEKGVQEMTIFGGKTFLKIAAAATVGFGLSGCVYDVGLGYASDGYYNDYYDCDPFGGYDSYYSCDYGHGFYNIGYGGGWYDNYWYPGYGFYLFDRYGSRYPMRDNHRRYWGQQRHNWYRENRERNHDGGRYEGRGRNYSGNPTPGTIGWPERNGGRIRDGEDNRRGRSEGRRSRNDQWRGGEGNGANAIPTPNPEIVQRPGRGRGRDAGAGNGRRRGGDGQGQPAWRGYEGVNAAPAVAQPDQPGARQGGRGDRPRGEGRSFRQPAPQPSSGQTNTPAYRPAQQPRRDSPRQEARRQRGSEGLNEQPE